MSKQPKKQPFSFQRRRFYVGVGDDLTKYKDCIGKSGAVVPISSNACFLHTVANSMCFHIRRSKKDESGAP